MPEGNYVGTIREAAKVIGVHQQTFKEWLADGAPKKTKDGYDIDAIVQWRAENRRGPTSTSSLPDDESVSYERRMADARLGKLESEHRKFKADADLKEYQVRELQGDLCFKLDVANVLADMLRELRNELGKIPGQLAAGFSADLKRQIEEDCRGRIDISLRAAHSRLQKYLDP